MQDVVALRLEGPEPSVNFRRGRLLAEFSGDGEATTIGTDASVSFWRAIRDLKPLAEPGERAVWQVSVAPSRGAEVAESIAHALDASWYLDWGGGLLCMAIAGAQDGGATVIRAAIRGAGGRGTGHATLISGSPALRRLVPVFEPQTSALAALADRIKDGFDPRRILNPGRMVEGR